MYQDMPHFSGKGQGKGWIGRPFVIIRELSKLIPEILFFIFIFGKIIKSIRIRTQEAVELT
jgi:hypothetical protein